MTEEAEPITEEELAEIEEVAAHIVALTDERDAPSAHLTRRLVAEVRRLRARQFLWFAERQSGLGQIEVRGFATQDEALRQCEEWGWLLGARVWQRAPAVVTEPEGSWGSPVVAEPVEDVRPSSPGVISQGPYCSRCGAEISCASCGAGIGT